MGGSHSAPGRPHGWRRCCHFCCHPSAAGLLDASSDHLVRRLGQTVQDRPELALSWAGISGLAGQKISLGRTHAGQIVTVCVTATTMTIGFGDGGTQTVTRTTSKPVRTIKAQQHRKAAHVS